MKYQIFSPAIKTIFFALLLIGGITAATNSMAAGNCANGVCSRPPTNPSVQLSNSNSSAEYVVVKNSQTCGYCSDPNFTTPLSQLQAANNNISVFDQATGKVTFSSSGVNYELSPQSNGSVSVTATDAATGANRLGTNLHPGFTYGSDSKQITPEALYNKIKTAADINKGENLPNLVNATDKTKRGEAGSENVINELKKVAEAKKNINPQGGDTANSKSCIIVTPGPSLSYGPGGFWGYKLVNAPESALSDCFGSILVPITEDKTNTTLRQRGFSPLSDDSLAVAKTCGKFYNYSLGQLEMSNITRSQKSVVASFPNTSAGSIIKTIIPNKTQADEFIKNGFQGYTVEGGATMQPGNGYHPGDKTNKDINGKNVNISDSCQFTPMSQAEQDALKPGTKDGNPFSGPSRPGSQGGNPGGPGGGMEGMAGKLGELLKGLMSGLGKGNQQPSPSPSSTPFVCPNMTSPVCGNDNKTYRNSCEAEYKAQVGVKSVGYCPESPLAQCSTTWEPVCGNDNITYSNLCELQNTRTVTKVSSGICPNGIGTDSLTALSTVLKDATKTGVPAPMLENALRAVAKLISNLVTNPGTVSEVTVP